MTRLTDFAAAVDDAEAASQLAFDGRGFTAGYINTALAQMKVAAAKLAVIQSELGQGDDPSGDPLVVTDPA